MNVLHVITALTRGGAEYSLLRLLAAMDRKLYHPHVVSLVPGGALVEEIRALGIRVDDLGMSAGSPAPLALWRLRRLVTATAPAIIHGWMYHAALAALFAAGRRPVVVGIRQSLHDLRNEKPATRQVIRALGWLSGRASRLCFNATVSMSQHIALGYRPNRAVVVPNGFDGAQFRPDFAARAAVRQELGIRPDALVVGHLGRWHPVKNHCGLLAAFAKLASSKGEAVLVMAGSQVDQNNQELAGLAERVGVAGRVHLLGERSDTPRLLAAFDLLVNASRSEAFPNVVGEAMASAVPCVATDVGESRSIIGEHGVVVPPNDTEALLAGLRQLADLSAIERQVIGHAARSSLLDRFGMDRVAAEYARLYEAAHSEATRHRGYVDSTRGVR